MSHRQQHQPATARHSAPVGMELPRQRALRHEPPVRDGQNLRDTRDVSETDVNAETGGGTLVTSSHIPPMDEFRLLPHAPHVVNRALQRLAAAFRANPRAKDIVSDIAAVMVAVLTLVLGAGRGTGSFQAAFLLTAVAAGAGLVVAVASAPRPGLATLIPAVADNNGCR